MSNVIGMFDWLCRNCNIQGAMMLTNRNQLQGKHMFYILTAIRGMWESVAQNWACDWWRGLLINAVVGTSTVDCEQIGCWMSICCKSWLKNRRRRRGVPRLWSLWCKACEYSWRILSRGTMKVCWLYCSSCRDKVGHFSLLSLCSDIMPRKVWSNRWPFCYYR